MLQGRTPVLADATLGSEAVVSPGSAHPAESPLHQMGRARPVTGSSPEEPGRVHKLVFPLPPVFGQANIEIRDVAAISGGVNWVPIARKTG